MLFFTSEQTLFAWFANSGREEVCDNMVDMTKSVANVVEQLISRQFRAIELLFFLRI